MAEFLVWTFLTYIVITFPFFLLICIVVVLGGVLYAAIAQVAANYKQSR